MIGVAVEAHQFVLVYKRQVNGHVAIDQVDLFERKFTGGHIEFLVGAGRVTVFREQLRQIGGETLSGRSGSSCFGGRLAVVDFNIEIGVTDFVIAGLHLRKLFFADHGARSGIEDSFLLVHQVATVVDQLFALGHESIIIAGIEESATFAHVVAHHVVEGPHRRGGAVESLLFQHGVELILLALVVQGIFVDAFDQIDPLIFDDRVLYQIFDLKQQALQLVVLGIVVSNGVIFGQFGTRIVHKALEELDFLRHVLANALIFGVFGHRLFDEGEMIGTERTDAARHFFATLLEGDFSGDKALLDIENGFHFLEIDGGQKLLHFIVHV